MGVGRIIFGKDGSRLAELNSALPEEHSSETADKTAAAAQRYGSDNDGSGPQSPLKQDDRYFFANTGLSDLSADVQQRILKAVFRNINQRILKKPELDRASSTVAYACAKREGQTVTVTTAHAGDSPIYAIRIGKNGVRLQLLTSYHQPSEASLDGYDEILTSGLSSKPRYKIYVRRPDIVVLGGSDPLPSPLEENKLYVRRKDDGKFTYSISLPGKGAIEEREAAFELYGLKRPRPHEYKSFLPYDIYLDVVDGKVRYRMGTENGEITEGILEVKAEGVASGDTNYEGKTLGEDDFNSNKDKILSELKRLGIIKNTQELDLSHPRLRGKIFQKVIRDRNYTDHPQRIKYDTKMDVYTLVFAKDGGEDQAQVTQVLGAKGIAANIKEIRNELEVRQTKIELEPDEKIIIAGKSDGVDGALNVLTVEKRNALLEEVFLNNDAGSSKELDLRVAANKLLDRLKEIEIEVTSVFSNAESIPQVKEELKKIGIDQKVMDRFLDGMHEGMLRDKPKKEASYLLRTLDNQTVLFYDVPDRSLPSNTQEAETLKQDQPTKQEIPAKKEKAPDSIGVLDGGGSGGNRVAEQANQEFPPKLQALAILMKDKNNENKTEDDLVRILDQMDNLPLLLAQQGSVQGKTKLFSLFFASLNETSFRLLNQIPYYQKFCQIYEIARLEQLSIDLMKSNSQEAENLQQLSDRLRTIWNYAYEPTPKLVNGELSEAKQEKEYKKVTLKKVLADVMTLTPAIKLESAAGNSNKNRKKLHIELPPQSEKVSLDNCSGKLEEYSENLNYNRHIRNVIADIVLFLTGFGFLVQVVSLVANQRLLCSGTSSTSRLTDGVRRDLFSLFKSADSRNGKSKSEREQATATNDKLSTSMSVNPSSKRN